VILATSNLHKVGEMRELLPGIELEPLPEGYESPVEDGDSFEANALIKARAAHAALGGAVLASIRAESRTRHWRRVPGNAPNVSRFA